MLTIRNPEVYDWAHIGLKDCADGNILDSQYTRRLFFILKNELEKLGGLKLYETLISPITEIFSDIEYEGLLVDPDEVKKLDKTLKERLKELEEKLRELCTVDKKFNFDSVSQVANLLYVNSMDDIYNDNIGEGNFGLYPPDRTDLGKPASDRDTLNLTLIHITEELSKRSG